MCDKIMMFCHLNANPQSLVTGATIKHVQQAFVADIGLQSSFFIKLIFVKCYYTGVVNTY